MIVEESKLRRAISEALKTTDDYATTDSSEFLCDLSALESAPPDFLLYLVGLLYYHPEGQSKKSFMEAVENFFKSGSTLSPSEREMYLDSLQKKVKSDIRSRKDLIRVLETGISLLFFPTSGVICDLLSAFFASDGREDSLSQGDIISIKEFLEESSLLMMRYFQIEEREDPTIQILFPLSYQGLSSGKSADEIRNVFDAELNALTNILTRSDENVTQLERRILKMFTGVRRKRLFIQPIETYFESVKSTSSDSSITANQIRFEIGELVKENKNSLPFV